MEGVLVKALKVLHMGSLIIVLAAAVVMILRPFYALYDTVHFMLGSILVTFCVWGFKTFGLSYAA